MFAFGLDLISIARWNTPFRSRLVSSLLFEGISPYSFYLGSNNEYSFDVTKCGLQYV